MRQLTSGKQDGKKKKKKRTANTKTSIFGDMSIKEAYRKFLKCYDQLCSRSEKMVVPSVRRALLESKENETVLVKFVIMQPEPQLNDGLPISLVPLVDTFRHERYVHVRFIYVWGIPLLHTDLVALSGLMERKIYLLKHIELTDCLLETYSVQRLCMAIDSCPTMTTLVLDYNEFGDDGCHSICAGLRGNRNLLSLSLCFCNLGVISGEYLSVLVTTTAVRELYLDGNDLQSEGTIQILRFCVEKAIKEASEREVQEQLKAGLEEQHITEMELQKHRSFVSSGHLSDIQSQVTEEPKPETKKKKVPTATLR